MAAKGGAKGTPSVQCLRTPAAPPETGARPHTLGVCAGLHRGCGSGGHEGTLRCVGFGACAFLTMPRKLSKPKVTGKGRAGPRSEQRGPDRGNAPSSTHARRSGIVVLRGTANDAERVSKAHSKHTTHSGHSMRVGWGRSACSKTGLRSHRHTFFLKTRPIIAQSTGVCETAS